MPEDDYGRGDRWTQEFDSADDAAWSGRRTEVHRSRLWARLSGRGDEVDVSGRGDDVAGMLRALGGARGPDDVPNFTRAAQALGKHRSTVARWWHKSQGGAGASPNAESMKTLRATARRNASTRRGRATATSSMRSTLSAAATEGDRPRFTVKIEGRQGLRYEGRRYMRYDQTQLMGLTADQMLDMLDAYERGGDSGFAEWAQQLWGGDESDPSDYGDYLEGWGFATIDDVTIESNQEGLW